MSLEKDSFESELQCDICFKYYSSKNTLRTHKKIHLEEKSYKCDICLKFFLRKNQLIEHTRIHT